MVITVPLTALPDDLTAAHIATLGGWKGWNWHDTLMRSLHIQGKQVTDADIHEKHHNSDYFIYKIIII